MRIKQIFISLLIAFSTQIASANDGEVLYPEHSSLMSIFKWTADHAIDGFDSQDFLVLGFKPAYKFQKDSFKSAWSNTKQVAEAIKQEYTSKGTVATDVRNLSFRDIKFHKLDSFNVEFFKSAFRFPATAETAGMIPKTIEYVGDMFEAPAPSGTGMKIVHGVWVITQAGAFLLVSLPMETLATAGTFVGELAWNIVSRTFIATLQGLLSVVDLLQYPLEVLMVPWAVMKSILFQGFSIGVVALLWSWDILQTGALATIQVGLATGLGVISLGAATGLILFQTLKAIFYDAPRYVLGYRHSEYYFNPVSFARYLTMNSCQNSPMNPSDENEMMLYQDALKKVYGSDEKGLAKMSELSRVSQKTIYEETLKQFLSMQNAFTNRVFLVGDADLYLFDINTGDTFRIGKLPLEEGQKQVYASLEYKTSRFKKALKKLPSYKNVQEITDTVKMALARYEWTMQNTPDQMPRVEEKWLNTQLNDLRRSKDIDPEEELAFPYTGLSDICMFARAYRGLIDLPKPLAQN